MANPLGINIFSGPMGEKEPAYGAIERGKVLSAIAPTGTPAALGAPKRSQRAAVKGKVARSSAPQAAPAPPHPVSADSPEAQGATYDQSLVQFWQSIASDPGASSLVRQYAQEAIGGSAS